MRIQAIAALSTTIALTGCVTATEEEFVKNGMRYSDYELDNASCETRSTQEVGTNRSQGTEIAIAILTGRSSVQDANAETRQRNYEACMIQKGYQRVALPICSNTQAAVNNGIGPLRGTQTVQINSQSCVANDQSGRVVFHRQG